MKAVIAGAGIAGLATGVALRQAGWEVEIFERSPALSEIGAGLMIWPNGARSLQSLGVEVDAETVRQLSMCTWRGRELNRFPLDQLRDRYGFAPFLVHRAELQAVLAKRFGVEGINFGAEVSSFWLSEGNVTVVMRSGSTVTADLLVGADGLRSPVRRRLLNDGDPVYVGSTAWRGIARGAGFGLPSDGMNWVGRGAEFLAFHLTGERIYWAGVTKEPAGEKVGPNGHRCDLLERFGEWAQPIPKLISATDDSAIVRNDMYDRPPAKRWSSERVTLVGDAAHPMTPNQAQGACQALEDGVTLGTAVAQHSNLSEAFEAYERRRLGRANRVVATSRQATRAVQIENPVLTAARDNLGSALAGLLFMKALDLTLGPAPSR